MTSPAQTSVEARGRIGAPVLRETRFGDYTSIAALHARNGLPIRSNEDWRMLWESNPAFQNNPGSIGWVLENSRGEIVGSLGNVPALYELNGRRVPVAMCSGWVVDPVYRRHSANLMIQAQVQRNADLLISTTVSSAAEPLKRYLGWTRVPIGAWDESEFWVADYVEFSKWALAGQSIPLAHLITYPAAAALYCRDALAEIGKVRNRRPLHIEFCPEFDGRFDTFWEVLRNQNRARLIPVRTRATMGSHFRCSANRGGLWILTACDGPRLVASAIFDRYDNASTSLKRVRLVDFQMLPGYEFALAPLLERMIEQCRKQGVYLLESIGAPLSYTSSIVPPRHRRKLQSWTYYYKPLNEDLGKILANPAVWAPTLFDGDASL
jgi:hypothetical protein